MGKKTLAELAKRPDFDAKAIEAVLALNPNAGDESEFTEHVQDLRLIDNSFQDSGGVQPLYRNGISRPGVVGQC